MSGLTSKSKRVVQQTGGFFNPSLNGQAALFSDISRIVYQLNEVLYPLLVSLPATGRGADIDALTYGLSGNAIYTDVESGEGSGDTFYATASSRPRTITESFAIVLNKIVDLKNQFDILEDLVGYDDTEIVSQLSLLELQLGQIVEDTYGTSYVLGEDGSPVLSDSVMKTIDAIGALLTGYTESGLTHEGDELVFEIPQSSVTDLVDDLTAVQDFIGQTSANESPDYDTPVHFNEGVGLLEAVTKVDKGIWTSAASFFIEPAKLISSPSDMNVNLSTNTLVSSGDDLYLQAIDIEYTGNAHGICFNIPTVKDFSGKRAKSMRVTLYTCFFTTGSAGSYVGLMLQGQDQVGARPRIVQDTNIFHYGYKDLFYFEPKFLSTNMVRTEESTIILLDPTVDGLIPLKLTREFGVNSDDFEGTISILGVKVELFYLE